jgi:hypothetical protein
MSRPAGRGETPQCVANHASRVEPADACFRDCVGATWRPVTVAPMLRPRRAICVRSPLAPGHPREGRQALDRSAAADALPLKAALPHLDTAFELQRLSLGPGGAAVSRPTTRRMLVVQLDTLVSA